jgi:site-specific DNA-methyltransferase (adenine-specific)
MNKKNKGKMNRTLEVQEKEISSLENSFLHPGKKGDIKNKIGLGSYVDFLDDIKDNSVDLLFLDPPYNLSKNFNGFEFKKSSVEEYTEYLDEILENINPKLSNNSTIYICGDWKTSISIFNSASKIFHVRNRITWEREKGRGAKSNWKNCSEDIWFCTKSNDYTFNVDEVKQRRNVIAPYRNQDGTTRDWSETKEGNFRDSFPSNLWKDITIPFWSMPENTIHPTQKSEKLVAKLILASTNKNDFVFDPFLGSGTTNVVAKKLNRNFFGTEINKEYCLYAQKRLELAESAKDIQGYHDGVFWDRNTLSAQKKNN